MRDEFPIPVGDHLVGNRVVLRIRDDPRGGLDRHEQAVLAHKVARVRVVRGDIHGHILHGLIGRAARHEEP